ncbi:hypothetical protein BpHYR1_002420 [Brachionus plicatilis]|uniref:Uncharacterized protein n=1 Tax=Brachionus plicatilis TaxID=10195 RepID=A0A3M7PR82_BRAPC|nr:hypothetical protein BpHYR1_002420 [Brachionus plicatilis]
MLYWCLCKWTINGPKFSKTVTVTVLTVPNLVVQIYNLNICRSRLLDGLKNVMLKNRDTKKRAFMILVAIYLKNDVNLLDVYRQPFITNLKSVPMVVFDYRSNCPLEGIEIPIV